MIKKILGAVIIVIILGSSGLLWKIYGRGDQAISNFEDCIAGGNPVMESYPEKCRTKDGRIFVNLKEEIIPVISDLPVKLTESEARVIAEKNCIKGGEALQPGNYNENSKTWWFDANLNATREGCSPACVVSEETKTAEINWRCTGLIAS